MSHHSWLRGRTVVYNPASPSPQPPDKAPVSRFSALVSVPKAILRGVWRVIRSLALTLGILMLILCGLGVWSAIEVGDAVAPKLPDNMVLSLHLNGELPETTGMTQVLAMIQMDKAPATIDAVVDAIDRGAKDPAVKALAVKADGGGYNLSQLQSLRAAVLRFKASGKKTVIFSESYGEGGYGLGLYYLASVFDEIWMQPVGMIAIGGIDMEVPFFKDVMDQYGVKGQFFQRKEYKNAMEHLTSNHMSPASRESTQSLVTDLATQLVDPIKASRKKVASSFDELLNKGLLTDKVALESGLIDKLDYEDVMVEGLRAAYKNARFVTIQRYASSINHKRTEDKLLDKPMGPTIAVIPVEGMIISGSTKSSPYGMGDKFAGASDIVDAIDDAANDPAVKAIVMRINSPGGSPSASETIHRALIWAKTAKKKPVIVSMGALAASGGYWIAVAGDKIYAMDSTLTGSIGVVGGKINLQGVWDKFHVTWDSVKYGENSGMMSMNTPFSESEQRQFEATLDNVYDYFIARVAAGRKLTPEQVEKIAKGRAYTGRQAKPLGLVDDIGGMDKVLDDLAKVHHVASRDDLNVVYLPMTDDPLTVVMTMLSERVGVAPILEKVSAQLAPFLTLTRPHPAGWVLDEFAPRVRGVGEL